MTAEEFMEELRRGGPLPFQPIPLYVPDGDMIIVFFKNPPNGSYAKRINPGLTLFLDMTTDEIVGCEISEVKRLLEEQQ